MRAVSSCLPMLSIVEQLFYFVVLLRKMPNGNVHRFQSGEGENPFLLRIKMSVASRHSLESHVLTCGVLRRNNRPKKIKSVTCKPAAAGKRQ